MKIIFPFLICMMLFNSCSSVFSKLYDVKDLKEFNKSKIDNFVSTIDTKGIELQSFYGDSNSYNCIRNLPISKIIKKGFSQPIQILYFNDGDSLVSYHANCYAKGGLSNLNWDTDNRFSKFLPKSAIKIDSAKFVLNDFSNCFPNFKIVSDKKFTVIIFWTLMLEKISRSAIETVINNIQHFNRNNETTIYLINNDKSFLSTE